jgi:hypothetical protein
MGYLLDLLRCCYNDGIGSIRPIEHGADETSVRDDKNKLRYKGTDLDGLHFKGLAY